MVTFVILTGIHSVQHQSHPFPLGPILHALAVVVVLSTLPFFNIKLNSHEKA
jgi:hypothetical protein